jgi:hypothetical protein
MLTRTVMSSTALGTAALLLCGCGGGSGASMGAGGSTSASTSVPAVQPMQAQAVDTQQLLAMAQVTSETADPKAVGQGALMVADADDQTSDPIPVG